MVLISHNYKFIYIKNRKVAGSSVESFFGKYCISPNLKYTYNDHIPENINEYGIIGGRGVASSSLFISHTNAVVIKKYLGKEKFHKYLKFCVIRNPYDKMVSYYYWVKAQEKIKLNFKEFCKVYKINNMSLHTIKGKPVCDYYIRYENLEKYIIKLCEKLGINDCDINLLPKHKSGIRIKRPYQEYYDDETKEIVYNNHIAEFKLFGYKFYNTIL